MSQFRKANCKGCIQFRFHRNFLEALAYLTNFIMFFIAPQGRSARIFQCFVPIFITIFLPRRAAQREFFIVLCLFLLRIFGPAGPLGEKFSTFGANFYYNIFSPQGRSARIFEQFVLNFTADIWPRREARRKSVLNLTLRRPKKQLPSQFTPKLCQCSHQTCLARQI